MQGGACDITDSLVHMHTMLLYVHLKVTEPLKIPRYLYCNCNTCMQANLIRVSSDLISHNNIKLTILWIDQHILGHF